MVKNITIWSFLEPFLSTNEWMHLAEISKKLNIKHTTVRTNLKIFEKKGLLKKTHKGRLTLFKLNMTNPLIISYLSLAEKDRLIRKCEENLILNEFVNFMQNTNSRNMIIFGSSVQNINKAEDIDIIIIENKEINFEFIEKKLNKKVHAIHLNNLNEINLSLKEEIRKKHLIINGTEEVVKWLLI